MVSVSVVQSSTSCIISPVSLRRLLFSVAFLFFFCRHHFIFISLSLLYHHQQCWCGYCFCCCCRCRYFSCSWIFTKFVFIEIEMRTVITYYFGPWWNFFLFPLPKVIPNVSINIHRNWQEVLLLPMMTDTVNVPTSFHQVLKKIFLYCKTFETTNRSSFYSYT